MTVEGSRLTIACGSARFTLPTMPVDDYPTLPSMPTTAGTVGGAEFAAAVSQVAVAAGRDDTLPMLTGVRLEIACEKLTLAATDRYRLAVRELGWNPGDPTAADVQVLVPARTLADAAKSLAHSDALTIALSGAGGRRVGRQRHHRLRRHDRTAGSPVSDEPAIEGPATMKAKARMKLRVRI